MDSKSKKPVKRFDRFVASQLIWIITLGILLYSYDSIRFFSQPFLPIGIAVSIAILINLGIWFGEGIARAFDDDLYENLASDSETESLEKRKRERIDHVLRDLSDDDLLILRQRLQDGSIDDEVLYEHIVGDDGELIRHQ